MNEESQWSSQMLESQKLVFFFHFIMKNVKHIQKFEVLCSLIFCMPSFSSLFFKINFLKSLLNLLQYNFCLMFCFLATMHVGS